MSRKFTISQFERLKNQFLAIYEPKELCDLLDIKISGLWKFTKYQKYNTFTSIHKGKKRIVVEPNYKLKHLQRQLNDFLQAVYYFHKPDYIHGFVKCPTNSKEKLSILSNAAQHVGKPFVINADIFRFFPSITGYMVKEVFLNEPFNLNDNLASAIALLCIRKNWLPTGAPTSPVISNFVCLAMDEKLNKLAIKNEYVFTRYADDMTFSGANKPDDNFKEELTSILENYGFKLNYKKYRILTKHTRQTVTGIVVNEKLNVNREYKRNLRAAQHKLKVNGVESLLEEKIHHIKSDFFPQDELLNKINGKTIFVEKVTNYNNGTEQHKETVIHSNKSHFLLFADLELDGFVIEVFSDKEQAENKMNELWSFIDSLWNVSHYEIVGKIDELSKKSYNLLEATKHESSSFVCQSNGFYTVGLVELKDEFGIDWYLSQRSLKI